MLALERAQAVKRRGQELRAQVRAAGPRGGYTRAADIVLDGESSMRFFELIKSIPRVGDYTAKKLLSKAQINPEARINAESVGERRRAALVAELLHRANR
jgi:ABC-type multidrug transport system ATPase subunit